MQIYRGMDIGTAKPTLEERQGVPHHLLDICEPDEPFSVARYVELADKAAQDILSRGMVPIVAGGTGLYMDALIECSVFSGDETDLTIRQNISSLPMKRAIWPYMRVLHRLILRVRNDCTRTISNA